MAASTYRFLITGASSGLGLELARAALRAKHFVIGTARNTRLAAQMHPDIEQLGGRWLQLDVSKPEAEAVARRSIEEHEVNVIVNSAGYVLMGALEDMDEEEMHAQMETNFFGPIRVIKAAIPSFRKRKSGTIVNVSSGAGVGGNPACCLYSGSKFALAGMTEALAKDLASFNTRVLLVEPGGMNTNFSNSATLTKKPLSPQYKGTLAEMFIDKVQAFANDTNGAPGDPVKAAQAMLEVVTVTGRGKDLQGHLRVPLGVDEMQKMRGVIQALTNDADAMEELAHSIATDKDAKIRLL